MNAEQKNERLEEIENLLVSFCEKYFDGELTEFVRELFELLSRGRTISITNGRPKNWAAAIVWLVARRNFLFDRSQENHVSPELICNFFGTKKSTSGNKASLIEKTFNFDMIALRRSEIADELIFWETPDGFIVPFKTVRPIVNVQKMSDEEMREFQAQQEEERRKREEEAEQKRKEKKAKLLKRKHKNQLKLF